MIRRVAAFLAGFAALLMARRQGVAAPIEPPRARLEDDPEETASPRPLPLQPLPPPAPIRPPVSATRIDLGLPFRPNPGQNPQPPPPEIVARFPDRIIGFHIGIQRAAEGLDVGLNSYFRAPGEAGEELSQHLLALAVDAQGPEQEAFARRCELEGYTVVRQSNDGKPYAHVHVQSEESGLLVRLGVDARSLA